MHSDREQMRTNSSTDLYQNDADETTVSKNTPTGRIGSNRDESLSESASTDSLVPSRADKNKFE